MRRCVWIGVLLAWAGVAGPGCGGASQPRPAAAVQLPEPPPPRMYSHYLRGRLAALDGDMPRAIEHFRAAAKAAPGETDLRMILIDALVSVGRLAEARRHAAAAQERWPGDPAVWMTSGELYLAAARDGELDRAPKELERAARAYEIARTIAPTKEAAYLGEATAYRELAALGRGDPERLEEVYEALLDAVPESVAGHHGLARALVGTGSYLRAEGLLLEVLIDLDSLHCPSLVTLTRVYDAKGRRHRALELLRLAFGSAGWAPRVADELFHLFLAADERDLAVAMLDELARDDLDPSTRLALGRLYLKAGELERAAAVGESLAEHDEVGPRARLLRAAVFAAARDFERAAAYLRPVPADHPAYPECQAKIAEYSARIGRADTEALARARAAYPNSMELIIAAARVAELRGRPDEAREQLRAAAAAHPDRVELLYAYGAFEDRQGRAERAVELVEGVLERAPDHVEALNFIGFSLADRDIELGRARRLIARAMELAPGNARVLDSHGWLLFRQGRLAQARAVLEHAVRLMPRAPEIHWHLGEVLLAQGERARAERMYHKALSFGSRRRARIRARLRTLGANK